jgi:hypothetical protein
MGVSEAPLSDVAGVAVTTPRTGGEHTICVQPRDAAPADCAA